jgi:hypothetical protein
MMNSAARFAKSSQATSIVPAGYSVEAAPQSPGAATYSRKRRKLMDAWAAYCAKSR